MINLDSHIISNRPENVYFFSGVPNTEAAYLLIYSHVNTSCQVNCIMTPNENGEGARCDENSIWIVIIDQELPSEFFTKAILTPEGQEIMDKIIYDENNPPNPPLEVANT